MPNKTATINLRDLCNELVQLKGASFVTFQAITDPGLLKKGKVNDAVVLNPFKRVEKHAVVNGMVNFYYSEAVLKRLLKEGKTESDFRKGDSWFEPVYDQEGRLTPIARHKADHSRLYLRFMLINELGVEYLDVGQTPPKKLTPEEVQPYLPKKQSYINQGLDDPVQIKVYSLEHIKNLNMAGQSFTIENRT